MLDHDQGDHVDHVDHDDHDDQDDQFTMMVRESTWTNLFNLLEEHLQGWLDDLKVPSELSHHILQGILKDHVLKVKVLSENTSYFFLF